MPTLWERWTKPKVTEVPLELLIKNPLEARIGTTIRIDNLDYENLSFTIQDIREVKRKIGGEEFFFTDYLLRAVPLDGDPVLIRLRVLPLENPVDVPYKALILTKLEECQYDADFHAGLAYEKNQGEFTEAGNTYWRVDDVKTEWNATTVVLKDSDQSGKIEKDEVALGKLTYWDFWRETVDVGDNKILEFYFVEMDAASGYFEFWCGIEIDANRVNLL